MNLNEVLAELSNWGVKLWAEAEQLTPDLRNALAENNREYSI